MYLEYADYISMGGKLSETEYDRLEYRARMELNNATFNRITDVNERVKRCVFELVNLLADNNGGNTEVSSISNDGYSVNYVSGGNSSSLPSRIYSTIHTYLAETDLMYCGAENIGKAGD